MSHPQPRTIKMQAARSLNGLHCFSGRWPVSRRYSDPIICRDRETNISIRTVSKRIRMPLLLCCAQLVTGAQQQSALTIPEAVQRALDKYPAVRSSAEQVSAAAAGINLARTTYLPRVDFLGQVNRTTHNNVFGQLFPQSVIPSMTGPVLGTNSGQSVWGSAVGTLVSWEPIDFGLRRASVGAATATRDRANAEVSLTKLQVAGTAADAFLTIAAAEQTVVAAKAGVERAQVLERVIRTLAKNELRSGADASRAQAEVAL